MAVTWSSETVETQKTVVSNSIVYFPKMDLSDALEAQFDMIIDNESGSVTDGLKITLERTLDASSEVWHVMNSWVYVTEGITGENRSYQIPTGFAWRIGVESTGTTDDFTVDVSWRKRTE